MEGDQKPSNGSNQRDFPLKGGLLQEVAVGDILASQQLNETATKIQKKDTTAR